MHSTVARAVLSRATYPVLFRAVNTRQEQDKNKIKQTVKYSTNPAGYVTYTLYNAIHIMFIHVVLTVQRSN